MRLLVLLTVFTISLASEDVASTERTTFAVEGNVIFPSSANSGRKWAANSRVLLNHGEYIGFVREDGSFTVDNVASGSYVVQVENVDFVFEPIRVDITARGKIRARKLSVLQLSAREATRYFRKREEWRITDMLMNPMVLMLVIPLIIMLIIPKMTANDPQLQKEMAEMQMPKLDMPDVGEMMANLFGGAPKPKKKAFVFVFALRRKIAPILSPAVEGAGLPVATAVGRILPCACKSGAAENPTFLTNISRLVLPGCP
ncbi:hypothetical protein ANCDUO_19181 [Ancylostoma duodenale]|uniref:ER membrane protein complex subunit 7 beta-sandwich domain-containing protein n=1 Tax=Ancylostoma duodenale TaxID=51022 RepID=A0A0C2FVQ0_9BILA|nr:hypothetical protein ANCDUO_19181 [Ancylostoma duodenale]